MAQSIRDIIQVVNLAMEGIFKGGRIYGVANLVEREGIGQPVVDDMAVAFDDSYAFQMYHRLGNISVTYGSGYGDTRKIINTFTVSAVVFNNEKLTKTKTDVIAMILQSVLQTINITSVQVLPTQIILNSQQIFATEYRGLAYSLDEYRSLMQINYTVEVTYKGICFDLCPEDFSNCKN